MRASERASEQENSWHADAGVSYGTENTDAWSGKPRGYAEAHKEGKTRGEKEINTCKKRHGTAGNQRGHA